eukprot:Tbor_TRINITY_DN4440_c0_g1::TRINITY_DN4440_c0_g1_i1::g.8080::m.8080
MLQIDWPSSWNEAFIGQLKETLQNSLQKAMKGAGNKNNQLRGSVVVQELHPGTVSPLISLKHIHALTPQHISLSVVVEYQGDAYIALKGLEINLDTTTNSNTSKGSKKGDGEGIGLGTSSRGNSDNTTMGGVCNNENTTADVNHSLPFFCPFEMKLYNIVIADVIDIEIKIPLVEEAPEYYSNSHKNNILPLSVIMQSLQVAGLSDHEGLDEDAGSHQMERSSPRKLPGKEGREHSHDRETQSPSTLTSASLAAFLSTADNTSGHAQAEGGPQLKPSNKENRDIQIDGAPPSQVSLQSYDRTSTARTTGLTTTNRSIAALYNARYGKSPNDIFGGKLPGARAFNKPKVVISQRNGLVGRVRAPNDDELREGEVKMKVSVIDGSVIGRSSSHSTLSNYNIMINNNLGGLSSPTSSGELSALYKTDEKTNKNRNRNKQPPQSRKAHDPNLYIFRPYYSGFLNFPAPYWESAYTHLTGTGSAFDQIISMGRTHCASFLELLSFQRFRRVKKGDYHPRANIPDLDVSNVGTDKNHEHQNDNPHGGIIVRIQFFSDPLKSFSVDSNFSTVHGANEKIESTLRNLVQPALDKLKRDGLKFQV